MDDMEKIEEAPFRAGFAAIIGRPNVGKSTLMNCLVGQKVSIVTNKPQTTRHKILGIHTAEHHQVVFLDTPGLIRPRYLLQETMMNSARSAIADADCVLFMVDASQVLRGEDEADEPAFQILQRVRKPVFLIINKVDLVDKQALLPLIDRYSKTFAPKEIFPISALQRTGTDELLEWIVREMPEHPPYYPPEMVSEHSERFFVSEIIREKIFQKYKEEIPYSTSVDIIEFREREGRKDFIAAEIYVERATQRGILIGRSGRALKEIGETARKDIEEFLGRKVFLELHVKVREKWRESESWLKKLGYGERGA